MCFTVNVNLVKDELESRYGAEFPDHNRFQPSYYYHAYGLPEIPAICSESPGKISLLKWGLIPFWVKSTTDANEIRYKTFNARAETLTSKPAYKAAFKSKRCIIPVAGFFEWQHVENKKIPWYIYNSGNEIMSLAGLYDHWIDTSTGEIISSFTIVTTDANELMAEIHNSKKRMPVVLDKSAEKTWINISAPAEDSLTILRPCPSEILSAHTISNLINDRSADKNTPEVIRPYRSGNSSASLF